MSANQWQYLNGFLMIIEIRVFLHFTTQEKYFYYTTCVQKYHSKNCDVQQQKGFGLGKKHYI